MQWCRVGVLVVMVMVVSVVHAVADGEYDPASPDETGSLAKFDVTDTPKETAAQAGGRDDSKDPSRWIMNLVSTKVPPSKRYRRPTTVPPMAHAQGATESNDQDVLGLSVSPE